MPFEILVPSRNEGNLAAQCSKRRSGQPLDKTLALIACRFLAHHEKVYRRAETEFGLDSAGPLDDLRCHAVRSRSAAGNRIEWTDIDNSFHLMCLFRIYLIQNGSGLPRSRGTACRERVRSSKGRAAKSQRSFEMASPRRYDVVRPACSAFGVADHWKTFHRTEVCSEDEWVCVPH